MPGRRSPEMPDFPDASRATVVQHGTPPGVLDLPTDSDASSAHSRDSGSPERYELLEEIARGGMGVVYRARDRVLKREVGVKTLLHVPQEGSTIVSRFRSEAYITGQLQHPNIPPVHDHGTLPDGRPYLAMKLVKGRTLDAMLNDRTHPAHEPGRYLAIFEQIAQGVAYAHAHKVVHRDLKPLNVMVGAFGEVQVMDWGLAKVLTDGASETAPPAEIETRPTTEIHPSRDDGDKTRAGSVFGTPAYMPREQAIGAVDQIDTRSDVFSLGGILCALLTGKPPYEAKTPEAVRQLAAVAKLDDAFARLGACGAEPDLIALCKRCLSPERSDRPRDADEVAKAVAELRAEAERRARRAELDRVRAEGDRAKAEVRAAEQRKRRNVQLALFGALVLLAVGVGAFFWWKDKEAGERELATERARSEQQRVEAESRAKEAKLTGERDAEARTKAKQARQGVATNLALATDLRKQSKFKAARAALAQAAELAASAPELPQQVEQARADLEFVIQLDDVRYRKWTFVAKPGGGGNFNTQLAPPEYHRVFAARGLDLTALDPVEAANRIARSAVKDELVAAIDDWSLYEPNTVVRNRLLEVARVADPGPWTDRLRSQAVRGADTLAVGRLRADVDLTATSSAALSVLVTLMERHRIDPVVLLSAARTIHPTNFELTFALALWHGANSKDGQQIGPYEAARALRPENSAVWNNLGVALWAKGNIDGGIENFRMAIKIDPGSVTAQHNLGIALSEKGAVYVPNAVEALTEALKLDPQNTKIQTSLALALHRCPGDEAVRVYKTLIREHPDNTTFRLALGNVLHVTGDTDGAIAAYKEALKRDARLAQGHNGLGRVLSSKGDTAGAVEAYKAVVRLNPKDADARYTLGRALQVNGDVPGAIAAYAEAGKLAPKYAQELTSPGGALAAKGDWDGALAAYKEAVRVAPENPLAHAYLGYSLKVKGNVEGAIASLNEALRLDPKCAFAHYNLGLALTAKGDLDGGVAAYKEAIKHSPKYGPAHCDLGNAMMAKGDPRGAVASYKEAVKCDPNSGRAHNGLGTALKATGDTAGAISSLRLAIAFGSNDAATYNNLGLALATKSDLEGALATYNEAIRLYPKFAPLHNSLGLALRTKGDVPGALSAYTEAIRLDPKLAQAYDNVGSLYFDQMKYTEAIAWARAAIRSDPKYPNAHALLGLALQRTGDIPGARAALTDAARLDKDWSPVLASLPSPPSAPPPREVKRP